MAKRVTSFKAWIAGTSRRSALGALGSALGALGSALRGLALGAARGHGRHRGLDVSNADELQAEVAPEVAARLQSDYPDGESSPLGMSFTPIRVASPTPRLWRSGLTLAHVVLLSCALGRDGGAPNVTEPDRHSAPASEGKVRETRAPVRTGGVKAGVNVSRRRELAVGRLRVSFEAPPGYDEAPLLAWLERCAAAVALYYGEFPVPLARVSIDLFDGAGIHGGQARPTSPPSVVIRVGTRSSARQFERNWSMTHELVHLAFPNVQDQHHWIEEGLATYVEPIARARLGWITEDDVWAEWIENMPLGVPRTRGLDQDSSWAATYWGGALFCLLADIEIREHTAGRFGLEHALRAIVAAGGTLSERWPLTRALETGDRATGTTALMDTYHTLADHPRDIDLPALWRKLGVSTQTGSVHYDDTAPNAALRRTIIAAPH